MRNITCCFLLLICFCSCTETTTNVEEMQCDNGTYVGDVILQTQQEVDDFGLLCYTTIDGKLILGNTDYDPNLLGSEQSNITNVLSLNALTEITDELIFYACPQLQNLEGLNSLTTIGNAMTFSYCESLNSLEHLNNLQVQNNAFDFYVTSNDGLTNLNGLDGLMEVRLIDLRGMSNLENLQGLNNLQTLDQLDLFGNASINNLNGINNVETILRIGISFCNTLETLEAINSNQSLVYLDLGFNPALTNVTGIESSLNPNMDFIRISHTNLENISFLSSIMSTTTLNIDTNNNLLNLQGLDNLSEVFSAHVTENSNLTSLDGLESLNLVNTQLNIVDNATLVDFCSTQNLFTNGTYTNVVIEDNAFNPTILDITNGNCSQ